MDEYGEFIDDDDEETPAHATADTDEPELPGLTDEAKRLLEVAREELEAEGGVAPVVRWLFQDS